MYNELKINKYIAVVYYVAYDVAFMPNDFFDMQSMIFKNQFTIDTRYDLYDLCNDLLKNKKVMPVAIDVFFPDCTLDIRYRVVQNNHKLTFVQW